VPPSILLPLWGDLEDVPMLNKCLMIQQVRCRYVPHSKSCRADSFTEPSSDIDIYKQLSSEERNGRAVERDGPRVGENPVAMLCNMSAQRSAFYIVGNERKRKGQNPKKMWDVVLMDGGCVYVREKCVCQTWNACGRNFDRPGQPQARREEYALRVTNRVLR
jgi:hypothetical protein